MLSEGLVPPEIIIQIRKEIGLPIFQLQDKVLCKLYNTNDITFIGTIYSITSAYNEKLYLVNCPYVVGFPPDTLNIKAKNLKDLDSNLFYRWVQENTLTLVGSL